MEPVIYVMPEQQEALNQFKEGKVATVDYHEWHDVPNNRYLIYTGEDMPQAAAVE